MTIFFYYCFSIETYFSFNNMHQTVVLEISVGTLQVLAINYSSSNLLLFGNIKKDLVRIKLTFYRKFQLL